MADKPKMAVAWTSACGGCDVSLLDTEEGVLDLAAAVELVYWPVALDFKRHDLAAYGPGEIDIGVINGAVRSSEHLEDVRLLRERCKVLVAYGSCAAFGGIPGLANLSSREALLDRVYGDTPSTENPDGVRPLPSAEVDGRTLELPELHETVKAVPHVVEVDYVVPGCPPTPARVAALVQAVIEHARGAELPPRGTVFASDKALCDECDRAHTRTGRRLQKILRPHQVAADPERCFLEQGILCLGLATRGGCGGSCISVNMPCRGCFGPPPEALDPGAEALSAIGSVTAEEQEDDLIPGRRLAGVRSIVDVAGTFYRFTLPSAALFRGMDDKPRS